MPIHWRDGGLKDGTGSVNRSGGIGARLPPFAMRRAFKLARQQRRPVIARWIADAGKKLGPVNRGTRVSGEAGQCLPYRTRDRVLHAAWRRISSRIAAADAGPLPCRPPGPVSGLSPLASPRSCARG
jgi:hypothetical protein